MNKTTRILNDKNPDKTGKTRYIILLMLFLVTTINYSDRAVLSIAGVPLAQELSIDPVSMGYIFSAFAWSYVIGQIPGGKLADRYGSRRVYFWSILIWSILTVLQAGVFIFKGVMLSGVISLTVISLFTLRFLVGLAESPAFPGNSRVVSSWFPTKERGTASAVFNSAQYFATALFAPIIAWFTASLGWESAFIFMGCIGIVFSFIWLRVVYTPDKHPRISSSEYDFIKTGGALVNLEGERVSESEDVQSAKKSESSRPKITIRMLLSQRMLLGIYLAQYSISTLTWFFISWFPIYLIKERGMSILSAGFAASLPAICGFCGGVLGGVISDTLLKKGYSLSFSRKIPIIFGMLCSMSIIVCNYIDSVSLVIFFMSLSFFGKGVGALGWAVVSDTSPKEAIGLSGGLFNTIGNISGIVTPIVIGYIIKMTNSFDWALVYVACFALATIFFYVFMVGDIKRVNFSDLSPEFNNSSKNLPEIPFKKEIKH